MMLEEALEQVLETIDEVSGPEDMSKEEYKEFIDSLIADLRIRKEEADEEE